MVGVHAAPALLAGLPRLGGQVVQQPPLVAGGVLDDVSQPPARPEPLGLHIPAQLQALLNSRWKGGSAHLRRPSSSDCTNLGALRLCAVCLRLWPCLQVSQQGSRQAR